MSKNPKEAARKIGTLNEKALHAALKKWYARPGDRLEVLVDGFLVDIVRGRLLVEIQTRNFSAIKRKLKSLAARHRVRLVYPIAREKWIVRMAGDGEEQLGRRKSPKRGSVEQVFEELVSIPALLAHPDFSVEVLFIQEEEVRRYDPHRGWRRHHWMTEERRLLDVVGQRLFETPADMAGLIPPALAEPFTTAELAESMDKPRWLAQQMAYCLRYMGAVQQVGKRRNAILYVRAAA
ncbi:MAG: hypothetical protein KAX44_03565 [Candidatus Brocadiae bacterium]|nr:hypothetical protein [Candidatus Brocadiia bacterium]